MQGRPEGSRGEEETAWRFPKKKRVGRGITMELKKGFLARVRKSGKGQTKGQTMTEYSIIVLFVGLAAFSAYSELGFGLKAFASNVVAFVSTAVSAL
jgi:Flp pilus assembly pilin Flp